MANSAETTNAWRLFIGMWDDGDPDWAHLNETTEDYNQARAALIERYIRWRSDSCSDCVAAAAGDEEWLAELPAEAEFVGEVDGEDYLLIRAERHSTRDLWDERLATRPPREVSIP
jgi:diadenosine tetraphosphatase ApaH/serine/threonine PP2A family protein phosphatase